MESPIAPSAAPSADSPTPEPPPTALVRRLQLRLHSSPGVIRTDLPHSHYPATQATVSRLIQRLELPGQIRSRYSSGMVPASTARFQRQRTESASDLVMRYASHEDAEIVSRTNNKHYRLRPVTENQVENQIENQIETTEFKHKQNDRTLPATPATSPTLSHSSSHQLQRSHSNIQSVRSIAAPDNVARSIKGDPKDNARGDFTINPSIEGNVKGNSIGSARVQRSADADAQIQTSTLPSLSPSAYTQVSPSSSSPTRSLPSMLHTPLRVSRSSSIESASPPNVMLSTGSGRTVTPSQTGSRSRSESDSIMSSFSDSATVSDAAQPATNTPPVLRINHRATLEAAKIQRQAVHPSPPPQMVQSQIIPSQIIPSQIIQLQTVSPQIIPSVPSSIEWIQTQPEEATPLPAHRNHIQLWDSLDSSDFPQSQPMASPATPYPCRWRLRPSPIPDKLLVWMRRMRSRLLSVQLGLLIELCLMEYPYSTHQRAMRR